MTKLTLILTLKDPRDAKPDTKLIFTTRKKKMFNVVHR